MFTKAKNHLIYWSGIAAFNIPLFIQHIITGKYIFAVLSAALFLTSILFIRKFYKEVN